MCHDPTNNAQTVFVDRQTDRLKTPFGNNREPNPSNQADLNISLYYKYLLKFPNNMILQLKIDAS